MNEPYTIHELEAIIVTFANQQYVDDSKLVILRSIIVQTKALTMVASNFQIEFQERTSLNLEKMYETEKITHYIVLYGEGLICFSPYLSIHEESTTFKKAQTFYVQNRYFYYNSFKCLC